MTILAPLTPSYTGEPGSTLDWPTAAAFRPQRMAWSVMVSKTAWAATYTGQVQSITHLADRLRVRVDLPPAKGSGAAEREAYFMAAVSRGHWLRVGHFLRPLPAGTLRGTPTAAVAAAAGTRTITVQTTAGATLAAADLLGANGQLMQCAYGGAVADAGGLLDMPLVLPLRRALAAGASLTWDGPTGTFQVLSVEPVLDYGPGGIQQGLTLELAEVYT